MATRPARRRAQRGLALLGLLAVIVMVFAWILTSRLNAANSHVSLDREHNARVMSRAKTALIGYMAQKAAMAGENNPGSLPCPEAPADFNVPGAEGTANGNCSLPAVGRLPWRTIGVEKLVDSAGEPLWYVVSPGWALSGTRPVINPASAGQLAVDGAANAAVALIIAPGPAVAVPAAAGCTAWAQARPAAGAPDKRNYLECGNATNNFVSSSANASFNDHILRVTVDDVMPSLEAAIHERAQREIAPALRTVYALDSSRRWVASSTNPVYPYAAVFEDPTETDPAVNNYQGSSTTYQGLLPVVRTQGCTVGGERCTTLSWTGSSSSVSPIGGFGSIYSPSCSGSTVRVCTGQFEEDPDPDLQDEPGILIQMTAIIDNVAMGLRRLDWSKVQVEARNMDPDPWQPVALEPFPDTRAVMNTDGSVTVRLRARLPNIDEKGWGTWAEYKVTLDKAVISDHALLDTSSSNPLGWFAHNEWYRFTYYAVAQANTAAALASFGCNSSTCLSVNDPATQNVRALLVLAGRGLTGQTRPSSTLSHYLEYENYDLDAHFEQRRMRNDRVMDVTLNAPWNDRLVIVDWITPSPTFPLAYVQ